MPPIEASLLFPFLTFMAGLSPSPDWFTGSYTYWLIDEYSRTWYDHIKLQTYAWDAGTDAGTTYTSEDRDLDPPVPAQRFTPNTAPEGGELLGPDGDDLPPVAELECFLVVGDIDMSLPDDCDWFANPCCNETDTQNCGAKLPNGAEPEISPEWQEVLQAAAGAGDGGDGGNGNGGDDSNGAKCPQTSPGSVCTAEYAPVMCPGECEYTNSCGAAAAGFSEEDCTPVEGDPPMDGGSSTGSDTGDVSVPDGTTRVLVESSLGYGFFDGISAREPTEEEIAGIMLQTTNFYTDSLKASFPNLDSFEATFISSDTDLTAATTPVIIDFDANAFFTEGTSIPTSSELFAVLEVADYNSKLRTLQAVFSYVHLPVCSLCI